MQTRFQEQESNHSVRTHGTIVGHGVTDRGRARRANEDSFIVRQDIGVFVVCDGMGGAAAGETASRLAAETAANTLACGAHSTATMREAVRQANAAVYERARQDRRLEGMGTTLVAVAMSHGTAWIAHVGDSRCYRWRGGALQRLTHDHSLVEEQIRIGRMTREQARRSPMQNVITRAVGTRAEVVPDVEEVSLEPEDLFLLASDGLTRELTDMAIAAILESSAATSGHDMEAICASLVAAANAAGGRDNITCVLVRAGL